MKKFKLLYCLLVVSLLAGCDSDDSTSSESSIVADFSFTSDGSTFTFTNLSQGATTYRWDFGDLYFYSYEENPTYTYSIVGGELTVTLTAMNESGEEAHVSKMISAPVIINANIDIDGDFEDWEEVPVSYEFAGTVKKMKYYTKGPNIDIYFEGGSDMTLEITDMLFNVDEDNGTGYNETWNIGAEYLFEGPPVLGSWGSFYSYPGGSGGWAWDWIGLDGHGFESSGVIAVDGSTNAIEMRFPKSFFGTVGDSIDFGMWLNWGVEYYPADTAGPAINIEIQK
ncbi:PKD domain-containing protein [Allomuricauda sp. M10]|jgi:FOG: PKD repeat|uniref:PKD domain-containing protein n=1 Tax=Allomuricauda sp. M10 TaxID=2683292 RepID=UPI001D18B3B4|nr:PKD domain-containing protein [Muricauda sp. M10]